MNELSLEAVVSRLNVALSDDDADSVLAELRAAANERGIDAASIASDTASLVDVLRIVAALARPSQARHGSVVTPRRNMA